MTNNNRMCNIAYNGSVELYVSFLKEDNTNVIDHIYAAAGGGNIPLLEWFVSNNHYIYNIGLCDRAATNGQLETLKWLKQHDAKWSKNICENAAYNGHLPVLQWWLKNEGRSLDKDKCVMAAVRFLQNPYEDKIKGLAIPVNKRRIETIIWLNSL